MQAWAPVAIAQTALIGLSLWRAFHKQVAWWPGIAIFAVASLATIVMLPEGGYHTAIAVFGAAVLASDALFLKSAVVASLCTRAAPVVEEVEEAAPEVEDTKDAS